jgi:hypothetical protein
MKKIIFFSILISFLSCKNTEDKPVEENVPQVVDQVELPEYSIIKKEDVSIRTQLDVDSEINKRFIYRVLVSDKIRREQITPLFTKLIKDITSLDDDIDDITIGLYSNKDIIDGRYDVAIATWAPADGEITNDIALMNNRDSYKLDITISDNLEEYLGNKSIETVKFGLSEDERKQISIEIGKSENRARIDTDKIYPIVNTSNGQKYGDKLDELQEKYKNEIIKSHKINEDIYLSIMGEGIEKRWD